MSSTPFVFDIEWTENIAEINNNSHIQNLSLHKAQEWINHSDQNHNTILVCSSGDVELNKPLSLTSYIKKVYTTNCNIPPDDIYQGIPYGTLPRQASMIANFLNNTTKNILAYANFGIGSHRSRPSIWNIVQQKDFIYKWRPSEPNGTPHSEETHAIYFDHLARSKFCICPRGNGIDTYRMWECLMLNTIPIVTKSDMIEHFKYDLPILDIDDYNILTEQFLNDKYEEMSNKIFNKNFLSIEYWINRWKQDILNF